MVDLCFQQEGEELKELQGAGDLVRREGEGGGAELKELQRAGDLLRKEWKSEGGEGRRAQRTAGS